MRREGGMWKWGARSESGGGGVAGRGGAAGRGGEMMFPVEVREKSSGRCT